MSRIRTALTFLLTGLILATACAADTLDELLERIPAAGDAQREALGAALVKRGPAGVKALADRLVAPGTGNDTRERMALHAMAIHVGRAGAEAERKPFSLALAVELKADSPWRVKGFLLRQLRLAGGPEVIDAVAPLLADENLCEPAAQTLLSIGGPKAVAAFRRALPKATGGRSVTILKGLGHLRDRPSVGLLRTAAVDADREVRLAALCALAEIGDPSAADILRKAADATGVYERAKATTFLLRFTARLAASGEKALAGKLLRALYASRGQSGEVHVQCAALRYLAKALGEESFDELMAAAEAGDPQIRRAALAAAMETPGEGITRAWVGRMKQAKPAVRAELLGLLAGRGDPAALPAVLEQITAEDASVRSAAIAACGRLGTEAVIDPLLGVLKSADAATGRAVRRALIRIPQKGVTAALAGRLSTTAAAARAALLDVLAARDARAHLPLILRATRDGDAAAREAAIRAVGVLGDSRAADDLVTLLVEAGEESTLPALESALAAICKRQTDKPACGRLILAAVSTSRGERRQVLIRLLRHVGDAAALTAVTAAAADADEGVRDAAVRTLAAWPDAAAAPALLTVAKTADSPVRRVLAFRGYLRMLKLPAERTAEQEAGLYEEAIAAAPRVEEKQQALAQLAGVKSLPAMALAKRYLKDPALADEAAAAAVRIARAVSGAYPDEAKATLNEILAATGSKAVAAQARDALAAIERFADYVMAWQVSGPYTKGAANGTGLLDVPHAPQREPAKAKWSLQPMGLDPKQPWLVMLDRTIGGSNRVAYLRTFIRSEKPQAARLEMGSDDGLIAWLNGKQVHAAKAPRSFVAAQDKVAVQLHAGWNELMLKVAQDGGNWSAAVRIRAADGGKLTGIQIRAQKETSNMSAFSFSVLVLVVPLLTAVAADPAPATRPAEDPAERIGFRLGMQAYTFRMYTFFEAIEKTASLELKYIEAYPGQRLSKATGGTRMDHHLSAELRKKVKQKLADAGVTLVNYGVVGLGGEASARKVFEFAKDMGIETIVSEPSAASLPMLDKLCGEYGINLAIHNHPKPSRYWNPQTVVAACKGLSSRVGACADTGHWMRSDVKPVEGLTALEGRIVSLHFKDLNRFGRGAHDVPWGTGAGDVKAMLAELHRQGVKAVFSIEYEHNWTRSMPEIARCVKYFRQVAAELAGEKGE